MSVRVAALALAVLVPCTLSAQVPYSRLRSADQEPESWLTYSGSYRAHRYSALDQINAQNVGRLRVAWAYQIGTGGTLEASPLVADGVMYLTEPPSTVTALDARTGRKLWTWSPTLPKDVKHFGFPRVNRGVALLDDSVYVGTLDAHLVALDARSGAVRWDVVVADNATGHAITVAPLALDGKLIVGISGGEAGIRGFLDAYDARSGKRLWRSWTVPGRGEPGIESWAGESWKTGGAPTWVTGAYDPELNLLYWGTGNPAPDWNGDGRAGDNLYSCSLLALDATTGERRWHFQFTPHDVHDWDANQIPMLVDAVYGGRPRKLVVTANRNAFYYVLDRETGEFLQGTPYATQTWAERLDPRGRPVVKPGTEPTLEGTLVWPSLQGATNWFSPAFSPATGLVYVAVREMGSRYYKREAEYAPGREFLGGGEDALDGDQASGAVRALELLTGKLRWEFPLHSPPWSGLLAAAGGLVFGATNEGNVFALDAQSGKPRWQFQAGGFIAANPVSFAIGGKQHVALAAGRVVYVFALP